MSHWDLTGSALWALAGNYTLFDNFFTSAFGGPLLAHIYLVGGQSVVWDNGNSQPPLVLQDNATLTYHNYNASNGILLDMNQYDALPHFPLSLHLSASLSHSLLCVSGIMLVCAGRAY